MVGSADPINGILEPVITKTIVLLHETEGSTDPINGILDPVMPETFVSLHETEGSTDPINGRRPWAAEMSKKLSPNADDV